MAKKHKKMSRAQAAAARHEQTPESIQRAKAKERSRLVRQSAVNAQKKASQANGIRLMMPLVVIAVIVIAALAFTIGPGFIMGG